MRRDPMAMKPFCGYNFADYFAHWLSFGAASAKLPKIFHVNWFRKGGDGTFLWPGFGENLRVLEWMIERVEGRVGAMELPIGLQPQPADLNLQGTGISSEQLTELFSFDNSAWRDEFEQICAYLEEYGEKIPAPLVAEAHSALSNL
jgi:phosphoenolpyruvate carboxykinase (GTP)